jgi:hypothetical protein
VLRFPFDAKIFYLIAMRPVEKLTLDAYASLAACAGQREEHAQGFILIPCDHNDGTCEWPSTERWR